MSPDPQTIDTDALRKLRVEEPSARSDGPIYVFDGDNNDVAVFYHNEHATVGQSYETALTYAWNLVGFTNRGAA